MVIEVTFNQVILCTQLNGFNCQNHVVGAAQNHNGHIGGNLGDFHKRFEAAAVRQTQIEENQLELFFCKQSEAGSEGHGRLQAKLHVRVRACQQLTEKDHLAGVILNEENLHNGVTHGAHDSLKSEVPIQRGLVNLPAD